MKCTHGAADLIFMISSNLRKQLQRIGTSVLSERVSSKFFSEVCSIEDRRSKANISYEGEHVELEGATELRRQ